MDAVKNWVLDTPPRLCQLHLYKGTEGMFACWATAAEMVVKWKSPNSFFVRPGFEKMLGTSFDEKVAYMDYVKE